LENQRNAVGLRFKKRLRAGEAIMELGINTGPSSMRVLLAAACRGEDKTLILRRMVLRPDINISWLPTHVGITHRADRRM